MHVMIDLETLDTTATTIVLSIGAVKFDVEGLRPDTFYRVLGIEEQKIKGRTWSAATLSWWLKQDKAVLKQALDNPVNVVEVLRDFDNWARGECEGVWGNGSDFDNAIMGHIFQQYNMRWPYQLNRCYRTAKNMYPHINTPPKKNAHNALDDAIYQAIHMRDILCYIQKGEIQPPDVEFTDLEPEMGLNT